MRFILELAEYQNDLHQVTATEESLKRSITFDPETPDYTGNDSERISTSPSRPARCLLIFNESGAAVGMAIFFYSYVTWRAQPGIYLEDFYVSASERGKGYGRKLIGALIEELRAVGGARLEWRVLDWNEASIGFYEGVGSTKMDGWMDMKLEFEGWNP
jgi:GNAT superfamily N-acetyltransferase